MSLERLDKILAGQGLSSRKEVRTAIRKGNVLVNGEVVRQPEIRIDPEKDEVSLFGRRIEWKEHLYLMMNKPKGVISATEDPNSRTVVDLVPEELSRKGLFPAGRLDKDTEGFLLLTDDGQFAHEILAPKKHVPKVYRVTLDHEVREELAERFAEGVELGGKKCAPADLRFPGTDRTQVEVTIHEGMYHQIKRMFQQFGYEVTALKRVRIGGLPLDDRLGPGECRELSEAEVNLIQRGDA